MKAERFAHFVKLFPKMADFTTTWSSFSSVSVHQTNKNKSTVYFGTVML